jgi:hypothetical protein
MAVVDAIERDQVLAVAGVPTCGRPMELDGLPVANRVETLRGRLVDLHHRLVLSGKHTSGEATTLFLLVADAVVGERTTARFFI